MSVRAPRRRTLQARIRATIGALALLLVAIAGVAVFAADRINSTGERFADDVIPLRDSIRDLVTGMTDEETGVRGYLITADPVSLEPYFDGRRIVAGRLSGIRPLLHDHPVVARLLRQAEPQIASLESYFAAQIARVRSGRAGQLDAQRRVLSGKQRFDAFRRTASAMLADSDRDVRRAHDDQATTFHEMIALVLVLGGASLAAALWLFLRVPRTITRAERRFRTAFDEAPIGMVLSEPDGRFLEVNAALARQTGRTQDELVRGGFAGLVHPEDADALAAAHARLLAGEAPVVTVEERHVQAGGEVGWAQLSLSLVRDERGRPSRLIAHAQDISERKAHEAETARHAAELERSNAELARSNAELEQFAYVASHDLSEPLRMISGFTQLLRRRYHGRLDSDADEFIDYIVDGASRMQRLINDLLVLSRVGRSELAATPVDMEQLVHETLALLGPRIAETGAEIVVDPDLPAVSGDAGQLGQVLQNLIANGLKFTAPERAPRVEIAAQAEAAWWRFSVTDNGIGIDPRHAERIFRMFQRLHARDEYPGTGIGLAVCRKIVERHGGRIWVEPAPGGGSRFCFTLPRRPEEHRA